MHQGKRWKLRRLLFWQTQTTSKPARTVEEALQDAMQLLSHLPRRVAGRTTAFGWDLDYVDAAALLSSLETLVVKKWNGFVSISDEPTIIDCGANVGISVLNYKRLFPGARITAFEPDPFIAPVLRRNLVRNGAADVRVVEAAVWTEPGEAPFFCEGADGSRLISNRSGAKTSVTVKTVRLADFIVEPVDLIKIDIEGAEFQVLPSIAGKLGQIRNLVIECHLDNNDMAPLGRMLEMLASAGFGVSINSYGAWRDLTNRPPRLATEFDQYALVCAWRDVVER
jgi:FkbM family methyltransferase